MFDEQMGFRIPKNHPTAVLKALDQYAENAFNDVAQHSELYGQEISGFLYSPYFFRRFLPIQFMEGLTRWKEDGKLFPLVEYLAKAVKIDSAANFVFGNPKAPQIVPFRTPARIETDVPFTPTKEEFERLYSEQYYYGSIYRYPAAFRIVYELKYSGYSDEQITRILTDFANSVKEPVKIGIWTLKPAKVSVKHRYFNCNNEIARIAYQNGASSRSAKIIDSWFDYVNETGIFSPTRFCRIIDVDGGSIMEFAKFADGVYWNAFLNELKTLAILEQKNDFVFEERKNFLPLSMLQSIPVNGELTYRSALTAVMEGEGVSVAEEIAFSEDFRLCFLRAGVYYTIKNRVAFEGGDSHGTTELCMALNVALNDLFALDSEKALEDFAESEFSDSSIPVQSVRVARKVEAFGAGSDFEATRPIDAFGSHSGVLPSPNGVPLGRPPMSSADNSSHTISDKKPRGIRIEKCIANLNGEKAYVGDRIRVEWLAPTIFGDSYEGTIVEIHDDRIIFDSNGMQPLEGVRDFTIIRRC